MATHSYGALVRMNGSVQRQRLPISDKLTHLAMPFSKTLQKDFPVLQMSVICKRVAEASIKLLDALVDSIFEFVDEPLLPSQLNFAPVEEIGKLTPVAPSHGKIPNDFPEGVYIRNGPNPLFGGLKSTRSVFGRSSHCWIEGEGMLHALYFCKDSNGGWRISYNNKHVRTDTFKLEKDKGRPSFLPAIEGDSAAVVSAYLLNWLRFGVVNKYLSNTSIFEHAGKFYSSAENHIPQEFDIRTLETISNWDIDGAWEGPFTSHPKKAPGTGELVIMGIRPRKPFFELGIVSATTNGAQKLLHKVDLRLNRCCLCHEIGITERYNVIMDFPVTLDVNRLLTGGPLIKYEEQGYARIGIMPRYGDAESIRWFEVETGCAYHIINCYERDDEVVVLACRSRGSLIPGPDFGLNKFEWFSEEFRRGNNQTAEASLLSRVYEWRLNMVTRNVAERNLTGTHHYMDFPMVNEKFIGIRNKYAYAQVMDSYASSISGMAKYGGLAKLYFEEENGNEIKVEWHKFPEKTFCSGAAFVAKTGGVEEDDGWIVTFVHDENLNLSQAYIVDVKNFSSEPVAKINLPRRVPYGFHGAFMPICLQNF
ncbi:carotenoid 9,10(9',10')-cleavage dioxygenase 1-like isoform X2 [Andrographis paniculata]|uniref:carotenoid 9,10(9',10')-cleavage dioxygenase 1-like isoform X2 n=1 Tax=Andrographis paniculata TaxID=175694 RepID=UPI0021E92479|nr:carotenoid 9,10(9',10')-cleavage dioxygenase 1-like isoform X2 [Andrographis paniculata]